MPADPDSPWYSTPKAKRHAKPIQITLHPDERAALEAMMADHEASASRVVGAALLALHGSRSERKAIAESIERVPRGPTPRKGK